ncbi:MAG: cytochrome c [Anaerolineales bacterium]|nr:cytochrome c [Anaerolineales bacterium]
MRQFPILLLSLCLLVVACKKNNSTPAYTIADLPTQTNVDNGKQLFEKGDGGAAACAGCHSITEGDGPVAPSLKGYAERASQRASDETAQVYTLNSIIAPGKTIVDGYNNTMPSSYGDKLSKQQIADLIAYLLTLN